MANPFVTIYTDGACSGNPGPGGWGVILMHGQNKKELSGGETDTTNNRMELLAVIRGLKTLTKPCNVELYSDSAYVINAFNQNWIENWQKSDWKTSSKSPVKNKDLWLDLLSLLKVHNVKYIKVKGHSDNQFNNRCDELARNEIVKIQKTNIV